MLKIILLITKHQNIIHTIKKKYMISINEKRKN